MPTPPWTPSVGDEIAPTPSEPLPPLTALQRGEAVQTLRHYLCESYSSRQSLRMPAFTVRTVWYPRDALPEGMSSGTVSRRSQGAHADPTYAAAMETLYGPAKVPVQLPRMLTIDHDMVAGLLASLPAHLEGPVTIAYVRGHGYLGAAERLRLSRNTVTRRCEAALETLCALIYGPRWTPPA